MKAMAPELIGGGVGFIYGYNKTGTIEGAIQYASYGVMLGGIGSAAFVKCFVAGTLVYVPVDSLPVTAATNTVLAMSDLVDCDDQMAANVPVEFADLMIASAAFLIGATGWAVGQSYVQRQRRNEKDEKKKYEVATDWLFGSLSWE
jgi:hypothetical protein